MQTAPNLLQLPMTLSQQLVRVERQDLDPYHPGPMVLDGLFISSIRSSQIRKYRLFYSTHNNLLLSSSPSVTHAEGTKGLEGTLTYLSHPIQV